MLLNIEPFFKQNLTNLNLEQQQPLKFTSRRLGLYGRLLTNFLGNHSFKAHLHGSGTVGLG